MFGLVIDASAGRFSGGRSFSFKRANTWSSYRAKPHKPQAQGTKQNTRRWGSALSGFLIGGLLASLLMGHGFGTGLFMWLILGTFIFYIVGIIKKLQRGREEVK